MPRWILAARVSECPPGQACELVVDGRIVALFHVDGAFHALDGVCPHQGGPLGKGRLADGVVTCPWHGWQFDVCTGQHRLSRSIRQPSFPTKVEADAVWIDMDPESSGTHQGTHWRTAPDIARD